MYKSKFLSHFILTSQVKSDTPNAKCIHIINIISTTKRKHCKTLESLDVENRTYPQLRTSKINNTNNLQTSSAASLDLVAISICYGQSAGDQLLNNPIHLFLYILPLRLPIPPRQFSFQHTVICQLLCTFHPRRLRPHVLKLRSLSTRVPKLNKGVYVLDERAVFNGRTTRSDVGVIPPDGNPSGYAYQL